MPPEAEEEDRDYPDTTSEIGSSAGEETDIYESDEDEDD